MKRSDSRETSRRQKRSPPNQTREEAQRRGNESKFEAVDVPAAHDGENDDDAYGDDDFEDYEEDFEDFEDDGEDNSAKPTLMIDNEEKEKSDEKERIQEPIRMSKTLSPELKPRRPVPGRGAFKSSRSDKQKEMPSLNLASAANGVSMGLDRRGKRLAEIRKRVRLQVERIDVFEIPSMDPWDFYIRSVGLKGLKRQVFCQTNEDAREMSIQTEQIDVQERGISMPERYDDDSASGKGTSQLEIDPRAKFPGLGVSTQICEVFLEENLAEFRSEMHNRENTSHSHESPTCVSEAVFRHPWPDWLHARRVVSVTFSFYNHIVMTAHGPDEAAAKRQRNSLMLCLWDLFSPEKPMKVLLGEGTTTVCLLTPVRLSYAVAGTEEGSIQVWDLSSQCNAKTAVSGDILPSPSFSTDFLIDSNLTHSTKIVDVVCTVSTSGHFHVASLDESMAVHLWALVRMKQGDDYVRGASAGSAVQLVHVSKIGVPQSLLGSNKMPLAHLGAKAFALAFDPSDAKRLYAASSNGNVYALSRFGAPEPPTTYYADSLSCAATSIAFNPFIETIFLVGYDDGSVSLFDTGSSTALGTFCPGPTSRGEPVISLAWSPSRPDVFFVEDGAHIVHAWDLLRSKTGAAVSKRLCEDDGTTFAVSRDIVMTKRTSLCVADSSGLSVYTVSRVLGEGRDINGAISRVLQL